MNPIVRQHRVLLGIVTLLVVCSPCAAQLVIVPATGDTGVPNHYPKMYSDELPDLPEAFNWMDYGIVTPPGDQGQCSSCYAFVASDVMSSKAALRDHVTPLDFSPQQQISCNTEMHDCCGGTMESLLFYAESSPMETSCTGYGDLTTPCGEDEVLCSTLDPCATSLPYHTEGYYTIDMHNEGYIDDLKRSIKYDGPGYFRFDACWDFYDHWTSSGEDEVYVYDGVSQPLPLGHAALIIGWDDNKGPEGAWLCKNSWGTPSNRPNGTFWISYSTLNNQYEALDFAAANFRPECAPGLQHRTLEWNEPFRFTGTESDRFPDTWFANPEDFTAGVLAEGTFGNAFGNDIYEILVEVAYETGNTEEEVFEFETYSDTDDANACAFTQEIKKGDFRNGSGGELEWIVLQPNCAAPCFSNVYFRLTWTGDHTVYHSRTKIRVVERPPPRQAGAE
jgi:hypothetical protein